MDAKLLPRIGTALFVGLVIAVTLVEVHDGPSPPREPGQAARLPVGTPLAARLRACTELGERALDSPDCRAAWAAKRRRFFGEGHGTGQAAVSISDRDSVTAKSGVH